MLQETELLENNIAKRVFKRRMQFGLHTCVVFSVVLFFIFFIFLFFPPKDSIFIVGRVVLFPARTFSVVVVRIHSLGHLFVAVSFVG